MKEKWFFILKTLLFLVFSFALLGTVIVFLGKERQTFKRTFILKTKFKSVAGLSQESPVYRYGLRVGHVARFRFLENGQVEVIMRIEARYHKQIRKGCYAKIVSVGILGDKAIDIVGGDDPNAPILPYGSVINSVEPFQLEDFISQLYPVIENVTKVTQNLAEITEKIRREHETYRQIFYNIEKITNDLAAGKGTLGALLQKKDLYQETLITIRQFNELIFRLQKNTKELPIIANETKKTIQQMQIFFVRLDNWLNEAEKLMKDLKYVGEKAKIASKDLPIVVERLRTASEGAVEVIEAAKKSWFIRRYLKLPKEKKEKKEKKPKLKEEMPSKIIWD